MNCKNRIIPSGDDSLFKELAVMMCRKCKKPPNNQCSICRLYMVGKAYVNVETQGMTKHEAINKADREASMALVSINREHDAENRFDIKEL